MRGTTELVEKAVLLLLLAILLLGSLKTAAPFIGAFLWGVVLAVSVYPLFRRVIALTGGRHEGWWATLFSGVFLTILMVPILAVGSEVFSQQETVVRSVQSFLTNGLPPAPASLKTLPVVGSAIFDGWNSFADQGSSLITQYRDEIVNAVRWLAVQGGSLGLGVLEFALAIVIGGMLLAHGPEAGRFARLLAHRLSGESGVSVISLIETTVRSVALGVVGTALLQGFLGFFGYWIVGLPGTVILGFLTFMLAIIQIGAFLIWIPAALWLLSQEQPGMAIFMALWGALVISSVDNIVRPYLISRGSRLPLALILAGVIGGMLAWGFIGIFLGATLLAIVYRLIFRWLDYDQTKKG